MEVCFLFGIACAVVGFWFGIGFGQVHRRRLQYFNAHLVRTVRSQQTEIDRLKQLVGDKNVQSR